MEDRQPEANRRTPPNGGRDLKQRRTGLFWSLSALQSRRSKRLVFLAGRADGSFPSKRWLWPLDSAYGLGQIDGYGAAADRLRRVRRWLSSAVAGFGKRSRRRVNGPSASPTRGEQYIASPANPSTVQARTSFRAIGGCRYDGPHQRIPRCEPRGARGLSSISTSCAKTISASPRRCRTRACSTPSRQIRRPGF